MADRIDVVRRHSPGSEITFGPFRLVPSRRVLLCGDQPVRLGEPSYNVLTVLLAHAGEIVGREQLILEAWGTRHIDESNLRSAVAALRRAFSAAGCTRSYVSTVSRRGYRFTEPITVATLAQERQTYALQPPRLIGRELAIESLVRDIGEHRLVTIVGPGGVGKTVLAIVAAQRACALKEVESVYVVNVATIDDPEELEHQFRQGLGMAGRSAHPLADIEAFLDNRRALIILDSCECAVSAIAMLAERVLSVAPNLTVLATSREPLRADGEWIRRLEPLAVPPQQSEPLPSEVASYSAIELFVDRATSSNPGFELNIVNARAVVKICRDLDGLPLAIEIAAARLDSFVLPVLAEVTSGEFRLQMLGKSTALPRHRTLHDNLDWSYRLLSAKEKVAFRRLAVFHGPATFEAARHVLSGGNVSAVETSRLIAALAAKSLIIIGVGRTQGKLTLLETTRAYAKAQLEESGERDAVCRRHAIYHGARLLAEGQGSVAVFRADQARFESTSGEVMAAFEWASSPTGDPYLALTLCLDAIPILAGMRRDTQCKQIAARLASTPGLYAPVAWKETRARLMQFIDAQVSANGLTVTRRDRGRCDALVSDQALRSRLDAAAMLAVDTFEALLRDFASRIDAGVVREPSGTGTLDGLHVADFIDDAARANGLFGVANANGTVRGPENEVPRANAYHPIPGGHDDWALTWPRRNVALLVQSALIGIIGDARSASDRISDLDVSLDVLRRQRVLLQLLTPVPFAGAKVIQ
ncbi:winged helix-turn-helix domain-containing protein [Paraburkholderia sp. SARCC-3016]|uniref:ATP-binding protein n=1 Tax=Paraburkholderia sp. SARCC-3016 TaxID=3058611 RepID=UPI00280A441C|nr:winged helix-turn-helix domain-containing protein [Paraburkholderia sp. SARCC-3016]MDQ7982369.1 winged helix-turn-helix domain-containing protein [Paraburkholderia sp. SARCC-3016]